MDDQNPGGQQPSRPGAGVGVNSPTLAVLGCLPSLAAAFIGSCGRCYEVKCNPGDFTGEAARPPAGPAGDAGGTDLQARLVGGKFAVTAVLLLEAAESRSPVAWYSGTCLSCEVLKGGRCACPWCRWLWHPD